jgi:hypothetical protein
MKKSTWLISVNPSDYENVKSKLRKDKYQILSALDIIGVITLKASADEVAEIIKIKGVLTIEKEREIHL